jgi:hypothetical protein
VRPKPLVLFSIASDEFLSIRYCAFARRAGFGIVDVYGVPVFVQPGAEDFDPKNRLQSPISQALEDESFFNTVLKLELKYHGEPGMANRGVNLLAVAQK